MSRIAAPVSLIATIVCSLCLAADEPMPLNPVEAIKQIGKPKILVQMTVTKAKDRLEKRGIIYLDSEDDFNDEKNLGVAISAEAAEKFKANGIANPAAHFLGKMIQVRGCIMRFEERPYLPVLDADQIKVIEAK